MPTYTPVCKYDTAGQGYDESAYDINILTDAISLSIVDSKIISGTKTEAETLSIIDTKITLTSFSFAETLHLIDTIVRSGSLGFSETLNIVDGLGFLLTLYETLSILVNYYI